MKTIHGLTLGGLGLSLGLAIAYTNIDKSKLLTMAAVGAIPAAFITNLVVDTKAQKLITQAQNQTKISGDTLHKVIRDFDECKAKLADVSSQLDRLKTDLQQARDTINTLGQQQLETTSLNGRLQNKVYELATQRQIDQDEIEKLQSEVSQWEAMFHSKVEELSNQKFQTAKQGELERIYQQHDEITSEAIALFRRLQSWGEKVGHGHQSKAEIIKSLASSYNQNLEDIDDAVNAERETYLEQIELLNIRISQLQQQLAGDLIEPQYGDFGFNESGRIANAIAQWLWLNRQLPLKVTGIDETDGVVTAGYSYSRAISPDAIAQLIKECSPQITKALGIYSIESAKKLNVADCLVLKFRRDRPSRKTDKSSLYRSQSDFIKYLLSQPVRWRIVGEPGKGKTPTVLVLMSHLLKRGFLSGNTPDGQKLDYLELGFCNPLAGVSVKNSTDLDFCLRWKDAKEGFKGLAHEYDSRKNVNNSEYKNNSGYIWICDEFDNAIEKVGGDGGKQFKEVLKDGGHINLGVIIMGQSGMVASTKGLSIDDQKLLTNIYIDPVSIRTFLTQYGERFYSKATVEKALATLEQLEFEIEEQNETICDSAREFRIGMVCAARSPVFYQLPYFDGVDIDVKAYQESLAKIEAMRSHKPTESSIKCPHCGSSSYKKNGKAQNKQRLQCRDCNKNWLH